MRIKKERPSAKDVRRAYAATSLAFELPPRMIAKAKDRYSATARMALMQFLFEYMEVSNSVIGEIVPSTRWSKTRKTYAVARHNVILVRRKHKEMMSDPELGQAYRARYYKIAYEYKQLLEKDNASTK